MSTEAPAFQHVLVLVVLWSEQRRRQGTVVLPNPCFYDSVKDWKFAQSVPNLFNILTIATHVDRCVSVSAP